MPAGAGFFKMYADYPPVNTGMTNECLQYCIPSPVRTKNFYTVADWHGLFLPEKNLENKRCLVINCG